MLLSQILNILEIGVPYLVVIFALSWILLKPKSSPIAEVKLITQPLISNPTDSQKVISAKYRVDAIARYISQTKLIPSQKRQEFLNELREIGSVLIKEGQWTEEQFDSLEKLIKG